MLIELHVQVGPLQRVLWMMEEGRNVRGGVPRETCANLRGAGGAGGAG